MDVEKEREAFEATTPFSIYINKVNSDGNKYTPIYYKDLDYAQIMSFGWLAWQAAKAQAVPEGFVLVPKEPAKDALIEIASVCIGDDFANFDESRELYQAMIKAQEPAND
ncbi:hypothetical protein [Acinetobacter johnsonii]|uniref:hypothetical protein n=1 Tax=Acinetobacter johnsonii TaxID=40214 RepID=UPI002FDB44F3|nr:hypothetical protein U6038_09760 [Acinetobacter johnsonii]